MTKEIINIFNEIKNMYKDHNLQLELTSGGLCDVNGINTSDVDISLYHENYNNLECIFKNSIKKNYPDENATIYTIKNFPREVNIYATDDIKKVEMEIKHRKNEIKLNKYTTLLSSAIIFKKLGETTESAWVKVLELDGDPYELMAREDIEDIAKIKEEKIKTNIKNIINFG